MSNVSEVMKEMMRQQLLTLHTCLICKVLNVYANNTAKVHPLTMVQTRTGEVRQHQALDGVPISDHVKNTIRVGSICIVVFSERDIAKAVSGEYALPSMARHHSLSDGLIVGTIGETEGSTIPGSQWCAPLSAETDTAKTTVVDSEEEAGKAIQVDVKLNSASDNLIQSTSDGLYAPGYTKAEIDTKLKNKSQVSVAQHQTAGTKIAAITVDGTDYDVYAPSVPTDEQIAAWTDAAEKVHEHVNKDILDEITAPYTAEEKEKLAVLENYTHPAYTAYDSGWYKVAVDSLGHVTDAGAVTKEDITALGIPKQDTTYTGGNSDYGDIYIDKNSVVQLLNAVGRRTDSSHTGEVFNDYVNNVSSGDYSHAEGNCTIAAGNDSHAEGNSTRAKGAESHAEGQTTTASGAQSHAEGAGATAFGNFSHAEGNGTTALGDASHAEGFFTTAGSANQHAQGKFNVIDTAGTYAFIIGNGTSSASSNALAIDWDGKIYVNNATEGVDISTLPDAINNCLPLSGGTMTGNLYLKSALYLNDGVHNRAVITAYDDGDSANNGSEIVVTGAGNTFIGAGESPTTLRTALSAGTSTGEAYAATAEQLYITSDNNIYFYSKANTIGSRLGIAYDTSGNLRPLVTGTRSLGSSAYHWLTAYINTVYGALSGNASTATKLQTARTINGVAFDGSADITIHETDTGWIDMEIGGYASSGTIQYRITGSQITVCGKNVVLAVDVPASQKAPQTLATCEQDFSSATAYGSGVFGSIPVTVRLAVYNAANLVDIVSNGIMIPAGTKGNFSITGFIE